MRVLDLSQLPCESTMRLAKAVPRREGAGLSWDVELVQEIPDTASAQVVDAYLPGTMAVWNAREASKGTATSSGAFDLMRVAFKTPDGVELANGHGEVRGVSVKVNAAQAVLIVKIRVHGLLQESAMEMVYLLDESVEVSLSSNATNLIVTPDAAPSRSVDGFLIVHQHEGELVAGVVTRQEGSEIDVATLDRGIVTLTLSGDPDTAIEVSVDPGVSLRNLLLNYRSDCEEAGVRCSWLDVIQAMGKMYASNEINPDADCSWQISEAVLSQALTEAADAV